MGKQKRKTAWYMMVIVSVILVVIVLFLPINSTTDKDQPSLVTSVLTSIGVLQSKIEPKTTRIILGGDVMLGRSVMAVSLDKQDTTYPFLHIAEFMERGDIAFVNLENAIVENCPIVRRDTLKFCARPEMLNGLGYADINLVTLANNHSRNYGEEGYQETLQHLGEAGIKYTDTNLTDFEINKTVYGFLGLNFTFNEPTEEDFALVEESAEKVDVLLLSIHWGVEYTADPREIQREWATEFVRRGADFIAGHHPHWVQSHETIDGVPVYYSLGNLVFDQMDFDRTRSGLMLELIYEDGRLMNVVEVPTFMTNWAQPEVVIKE